MYHAHATDVVGYAWEGDVYCVDCAERNGLDSEGMCNAAGDSPAAVFRSHEFDYQPVCDEIKCKQVIEVTVVELPPGDSFLGYTEAPYLTVKERQALATVSYAARANLADAAQLLALIGWTCGAMFRDARGEEIPAWFDYRGRNLPRPGGPEVASLDICGAIHLHAEAGWIARQSEQLMAQYLRDVGLMPVGEKPDWELVSIYNDGSGRNLQEVVGAMLLASTHEPGEWTAS